MKVFSFCSVLFSFLFLSVTQLSAQYISSTTAQAGAPYVYPNTVNQVLLRIEVEIGAPPITITNMEFSTNGCSNPPTDIADAKLFYYNDSTSFDVTAATLLGTFTNAWTTTFTFLTTPSAFYSGLNSFSNLAPGQKNYFWLTYNIKPGAIVCDIVDAELHAMTVNGTLFTPTVSGPAGYSVIGVCGVGLNEVNSYDDIKVFPVPSNRTISVSMNEGNSDPLSISLVSVNGKKMATLLDQISPIFPFEFDFSIENYPAGIYYLDLIQGEKNRKIKIVRL